MSQHELELLKEAKPELLMYLLILSLLGMVGWVVKAYINSRNKDDSFAVTGRLVTQVTAIKIKVGRLEQDIKRVFNRLDELDSETSQNKIAHVVISSDFEAIKKDLENLQEVIKHGRPSISS